MLAGLAITATPPVTAVAFTTSNTVCFLVNSLFLNIILRRSYNLFGLHIFSPFMWKATYYGAWIGLPIAVVCGSICASLVLGKKIRNEGLKPCIKGIWLKID
jgi:hypothetical protein